LALVASYVPTEVVGGFVAVNGVLAGLNLNSWLVWVVFLVLTPTYVFLTFATRPGSSNAGGGVNRSKLALLVAYAVVGYVLWTGAIPGTPYAQFFGSETTAVTVGGAAVLIASPLMAALAGYLGLRS
jgi:hypothetical protein